MIKKILIISDSHGKSQNVKIAILKECPDMLIHLGDIEDDPNVIRAWLDAAAEEWNKKLEKNDENRISLPVPAVFIKGNCDSYRSSAAADSLKQTAVFSLNNHRFFCTHGHRNGVNSGIENLMYTAIENKCDIALFGHTHVPFNERSEGYADVPGGVHILNPGSVTFPRGGSRRGYMVMTFDETGRYEVTYKKLL